MPRPTCEQLLDAIRSRLGGADEGLISLTLIASELGVARRQAQAAFDRLRQDGRIEVLEARQGRGTRVRIIDRQGGGNMLGTKGSGWPMDLRDSDPDGSLSGPVRTYRLTEEERRTLDTSTTMTVTTPAVEVDDWEPVSPQTGRKSDLWGRPLAKGGITLSAAATRALFGDRTGEARVAVEISRRRQMARFRLDEHGSYKTVYRPPHQVNARIGGMTFLMILRELGALDGTAYTAEVRDGWVIVDFRRRHEEARAS